jgi:basic membrane lipoprotein Med (substrate-binding protein (PBP1-ABC) superfamily)
LPSELHFALLVLALEEPWNQLLLESLERFKAEKPYGLTITYDYTENVKPADAERIMREYAETGKYNIIWAHSTFADQVKAVYQDYPEILFAYTGGGNYPLGQNAYYFTTYLTEPSYLIGMLAGLLTKTNTIGTVTAFPNERINTASNAFVAGARSVNPEVKFKISYIESFYDPPKAKDAAYAQIAAGVDNLYAQSLGTFEACREKEIYCYGAYGDQHEMAPDVVVTSSMLSWDGATRTLIDAWWDHAAFGKPYDAPMKPLYFEMADGGSDLAPFYEFEDKLPPDVIQQVMDAKEKILDGTLLVPLDFSTPMAD